MVEVPPVTREEILAVYEEDRNRVWSSQQLAERVWRARGGEGVYDGPPRMRSQDVPLVVARHLRALLVTLCEDEVLTSAVGGSAKQIGVAFDGPRSDVRYYGLVSTATRVRDELNAAKRTRERAKEVAAQVRAEHPGRFETMVVNQYGLITVSLTAEQALDLFALPDNVDNLAVPLSGERPRSADADRPVTDVSFSDSERSGA